MALPLPPPRTGSSGKKKAAQEMTMMMFWYGNHRAFWQMGSRLDRDPGAESLPVSG